MDARIEAEQIRHIYSQTPFYVPVVLVGAFLVMLLLWPATTPVIAIVWCVLIWIIYIGLWFLYRRWKQAMKINDDSIRSWAVPYIILGWLATAVWGSAGFLFFHADSIVYQSLLFAILVMGASAVTATSTAYSPTFYSVVLMLLPLFVRLLFEKDQIYLLLAIGVFFFMIMLFLLHRNSHAFYAASLKQRFINEALASELALQKDIAEQANADKSTFLATASHDLRQPLYALNLFLGELKQIGSNEKKRERVIEKLGDSINGMNDLFEGVLDVSRYDSRVVDAVIKPFCIDDLLRGFYDEYSLRAHAKSLGFHCVSSSVIIESDILLLRRIVRNLLENAMRYTNKGGVLLGCRRKKEFVLLQVMDTGVGIAPENLQSIFEAFQQLGEADEKQNKGVGLGLSVVKQLSSVLGHELSVESVFGKGSVFSLRIPLADEKQITNQTECLHEPIVDKLKNAKILLLGDEKKDSLIKELLLSWGCDVLDGDEKTCVPNIILVENNINKSFDVFEKISALRLLYGKQIQCVLMVEDLHKEIEAQAKKDSINIFKKTVNPVRLATLLRFLLAK